MKDEKPIRLSNLIKKDNIEAKQPFQKSLSLSSSKIKLKLAQPIIQKNVDLELEKKQQMEKTLEYQKQIDSLMADKAKLNDNYQRQLQ